MVRENAILVWARPRCPANLPWPSPCGGLSHPENEPTGAGWIWGIRLMFEGEIDHLGSPRGAFASSAGSGGPAARVGTAVSRHAGPKAGHVSTNWGPKSMSY